MLYQLNLSFSLSLLFMGFLFANLFGIITSTKSIVFIFILCIELINCFVYTRASIPVPKKHGGDCLRPKHRKPKISIFTLIKKGRFPLNPPFLIQNLFPFLILLLPFTRLLSYFRLTFSSRKAKVLPHSSLRTPLPEVKESKAQMEYFFGDDKPKQNNGRTKDPFSFAFSYAFTILNFLKVGFEFGFFVDAFKLGS